MKSIIIAYPIKETALQLKNVLESEGLYVSHICATGASVLGIASDMRSGIIVCANILRDVSAGDLAERLPAGFDIVALTRGGRESYMGNFISIPLPLDREEFVQIVATLSASDSSYTYREKNEADCIATAKAIIMSTHDMTETQAHKYMQQLSMSQSKKLIDIANEIIEKG